MGRTGHCQAHRGVRVRRALGHLAGGPRTISCQHARCRASDFGLSAWRATAPYLSALANKGVVQAFADDPGFANGLNVQCGHLEWQPRYQVSSFGAAARFRRLGLDEAASWPSPEDCRVRSALRRAA